MPVAYHMTWVASGRRWTKKYKDKWHAISCRKLGVPETKEASWRAANAWWERRQAELDAEPDDRVARAVAIGRLVENFSKLDDDARREAVEALLGPGSFDGLKGQASGMLAAMEAPTPGRTIADLVEGWKARLHASCLAGQLSTARYDAYSRRIKPFAEWVGSGAGVAALDEERLDGYYAHLLGRVGKGEIAPASAHELLMTAKQFIRRVVGLNLIPMPRNMDDRRFRFNHSAAAKIEVFTVAEVRAMLAACEGFSDRTLLYLLLCLNCGMYQQDIADILPEEVDWRAGTITRARSKTRDRGGPTVTYQLWPETFESLKRHRSAGTPVLVTEDGNPLVKEWLDGGKYRKYDAIRSAYQRLAQRMGDEKPRLGLKHLRKTSATILGTHPSYKFFDTYFLADSPKGMSARHYSKPNDAEFFEALGWLRGQILGTEVG